MDNIFSFFVGVGSSLVASYILYLIGFFARITPPKLRKSFDKEFRNQEKALKSIIKDAQESSSMRVITMKGDTFSHPGESRNLYRLLMNGPTKQAYLISDPENPYVKQRGIELGNTNLKTGIINSISSFETIANKNANIKIRKHKEVLRFRLIIFDEVLYLSFQSTNTPGRKSPMQRYKKASSAIWL